MQKMFEADEEVPEMREKPNRFRRKMSRALTKARLGALYKDLAEYECAPGPAGMSRVHRQL